MPAKKRIRPGEKVPLKLTAAERTLLLDGVLCLDREYERLVRDTPPNEPVMISLDDVEDFGGYVAAEANHCDDKKREKKLDAIFEKTQKILRKYTDDEPPETINLEDARKGKLISDQAVQITEWVAQMLVTAEQVGIKKKCLDRFWLAPAQRDLLLLVAGLPKPIKDKLAKENASFTVAEVASMAMALAEDLPDGDSRKQVAVLLVARHLMDRLREGIATDRHDQEVESQSTGETCHGNTVSVQDYVAWYRSTDLATDSGPGLHARQAARTHPNSDGLDELPSPSVRDREPALRRS